MGSIPELPAEQIKVVPEALPNDFLWSKFRLYLKYINDKLLRVEIGRLMY